MSNNRLSTMSWLCLRAHNHRWFLLADCYPQKVWNQEPGWLWLRLLLASSLHSLLPRRPPLHLNPLCSGWRAAGKFWNDRPVIFFQNGQASSLKCKGPSLNQQCLRPIKPLFFAHFAPVYPVWYWTWEKLSWTIFNQSMLCFDGTAHGFSSGCVLCHGVTFWGRFHHPH